MPSTQPACCSLAGSKSLPSAVAPGSLRLALACGVRNGLPSSEPAGATARPAELRLLLSPESSRRRCICGRVTPSPASAAS